MRLFAARFSALATIVLSLAVAPNAGSQSRIDFNSQQVFLAGTNIAWVRFAGDLGPAPLDTASFAAVFDSVHAAGGNALRLWLNTDGTQTPEFDGAGNVVGPGANAIANLQKILSMAWQRKTGLFLCLWSFDMQRATIDPTSLARNRLMLTDTSSTDAYIKNALIPMVEAVRGNPAIIGWEIFNEPEGMASEFGFGGINKVSMADIQRFVNLAAGAIHRTDTAALVTNGTWSLVAGTDANPIAKPIDLQTRLATMSAAEKQKIEENFFARYGIRETAAQILAPYANPNFNYYRDDRLKAAGGDSLGTLDFYTSHYYEDGRPDFINPLHNDVSTYNLGKPMAIGEFGPINTNGIPHLSLFPTLYSLGYAGGLTWGWYSALSNVAQDTLKIHTVAELRAIFSQVPDQIELSPVSGTIYSFAARPTLIDSGETSTLTWTTALGSGTTLNGAPVAIRDTLVVSPADTTAYVVSTNGVAPDSARVIIAVYPSGKVIGFSASPMTVGAGDPVILRWKASHGSGVTLNDSAVARGDSLVIHPEASLTYTLRATGAIVDSSSVLITAVPIDQFNRALSRPAFASSSASIPSLADPQNVVDGDSSTMWVSAPSDHQWIYCDLGQLINVHRVVVKWGGDYATSYHVSVSNDRTNWSVVRNIGNGTGGVSTIDSVDQVARYVLISLEIRASASTGFIIREVEVYGPASLSAAGGAGGSPDHYTILQNFPNPFNPSTTIRFSLPVRSRVTLTVYNVLGERVAGLSRGSWDAGFHSVTWNASTAASGVYFCRIEAVSVSIPVREFQKTIQLLLLK